MMPLHCIISNFEKKIVLLLTKEFLLFDLVLNMPHNFNITFFKRT